MTKPIAREKVLMDLRDQIEALSVIQMRVSAGRGERPLTPDGVLQWSLYGEEWTWLEPEVLTTKPTRQRLAETWLDLIGRVEINQIYLKKEGKSHKQITPALFFRESQRSDWLVMCPIYYINPNRRYRSLDIEWTATLKLPAFVAIMSGNASITVDRDGR